MTGKKITKAEIVDSVYEKTGINRKEIKAVVDLVFEGIKDALVRAAPVELRGFGTFEVRFRRGRQGARNPKTGEAVTVTSHGIAAFRPGRELKQAVWELPAEDLPAKTPPPDVEERSFSPAKDKG
ncbi:MAG: integration host factor subunit beta [Treponema sp.]|jgi:integration host factor subunit beta|nr:integration host factor subunit beta [Treponema sp.]